MGYIHVVPMWIIMCTRNESGSSSSPSRKKNKKVNETEKEEEYLGIYIVVIIIIAKCEYDRLSAPNIVIFIIILVTW